MDKSTENKENSNMGNTNNYVSEINKESHSDNEKLHYKKKACRFLKFSLITSILIVLIFTMFFCYNYYFVKKNYLPENYNPHDYTTFELRPDREISDKELNDFCNAVKERLFILGEHFEVIKDNDKITITVEKSMLGKTNDERNAAIELIKSNGNIAFCNNSFSLDTALLRTNIGKISVVQLNKSEILENFILDFKADKYEQIKSLDTEVLFALEITFDSKGTDKINDLINDSKKAPKLVSYHDYIEENGEDEKFFGSVLPNDESENFSAYIINSYPVCEKNAKLMKLILEQDEFDFGFVMQNMDEPVWETDEKNMGKNQVTSLDGFTVTAEFSLSNLSRSHNSDIECGEYETLLKERMDVLGINYMFGNSSNDDKTYCIKVCPEEFNPDFFRMIFYKKEVSVVSAFDSIYGFHSPKIEEIDGMPAIKMKCYYSKEELISDNRITDNIVYLLVNNVIIAKANITTMKSEDKFIYFTDFNYTDNSVIDENLLELVCHISRTPSMSFDGTLRIRAYDSNGREQNKAIEEINWKYAPLTEYYNNIIDRISEFGGKVEKNYDRMNSITIVLDIPINENLPSEFINKVKDIYNICNFDDGNFNEIIFIIKDEKNKTPADECRICFEKDMYDGIMKSNLIMNGPNFEEYTIETTLLINNDIFFSSHK